MSQFLFDHSEPIALTLEESQSEVDGQYVLAKVRGPFFFPGGVSRNQRYYPPELWENALSNTEVQKRLSDRTMLGTVYHPQQEPPLEDNSHIVTKLWIDPNNRKVGMGEALIINTEKGRALNTLLRLGSKWCVSSRATGKFLPTKNESGVPVVDPDSYDLQTFDFTPDPGFVDANPKLVESVLPGYLNQIETITEVNSIMNGDNTSKAMFESLLNEKKNLESTITDLLSENESYSRLGSPRDIEKALELSKTQGELLKEYLDRGSVEDIDAITESYDNLIKLVEKYKILGTVGQIKEAFAKAAEVVATLNEYKRLGSPKEIKEVYVRTSKMAELIERYKTLGTPSEIEKVFEESLRGLDMLSAYKELGSIKEIREVFTTTRGMVKSLKKYRSIGSFDEIQESYEKVVEAMKELKGYKALASIEEVHQYKSLGTPDSIQEAFDKTEKFVQLHKMQELMSSASNYASEFGLSESVVKTVMEAIGNDEEKIRVTLGKMREANKTRINFFEDKSTDVAAVPALEKTVIKVIADSL